jgi:hypothetical protein
MKARRWTAALVTLVAAVLAMGSTACPPNEAIICGSETENVLAGCASTYKLCAGGTHRLECTPKPTSGVTCACIEDGVKKRSFDSADACNVSPDTLKKRAGEGCNWEFDED